MRKKSPIPKKYRPISQDIRSGISFKKLFGKYASKPDGKSYLNVGLSAISTLEPDLYDQLFDKPALPNLTILADACFHHRAIHHVHKNIGRTHALRFVPGINQNASDQNVFNFAVQQGYDAIITYDCARSTTGNPFGNMCDYADHMYSTNMRQKRPQQVPGLILLSPKYEEVAIRKNEMSILEYTQDIPKAILDLRLPKPTHSKLPSQPQVSRASVSPP